MSSKTDYTDQQYWESYYSRSNTSRDRIVTICSAYKPIWEKWIGSAKSPKDFIEIGAYPGRYLAYLADTYQLHPTGLDFNSDLVKINESMQALGVSDFHYEQADFFKHKPAKQFDLVFSNGFIEHFENYQEVLDLHVPYLKPGGSLLIMIPNKRYLRKVYGWLCDYENLKAHNLKCMRFKTFTDFAKRNGLKIELLTYYGGFPYAVHTKKLNLAQRLLVKVTRAFFKPLNPLIKQYPNRFLSENIMAVFSRAETE